MKIRGITKRIEKDGWMLGRTGGDHKEYVHPSRPGTVTILGHRGDNAPAETLNSIMKQVESKV